MHHFFVSENAVIGENIQFSQDDYFHMAKVLRLKPGEIVSATDGKMFYTVKLLELSDTVLGKIMSSEPARSESPLYSVLVQGIAKGEKMDYIIQKATELGVNEIVPVITEYAVVKLDEKKKRERADRWQKIAHEAAKQCKRACIPKVHEPLAWQETLQLFAEEDLKIILWESAENCTMHDALSVNSTVKKIVFFIGPEGGLSKEEVASAEKYGAKTVTLGKRILRTETAGLVVLTIAQYVLGDLGGNVGGL